MVCYHGIQVSYGVGDAATVTVVDADLNTDSSVVETYLVVMAVTLQEQTSSQSLVTMQHVPQQQQSS